MTEPLNTDELGFRQAPCNIQVEQALLGALLVNNKVADRVSNIVAPEDFYDEVHGRIYDSIIKLVSIGRAADPVTLKQYFEADEGLEDVGGTDYLVRLAVSAATIINATDYAKTIADLSTRRQIIDIGEDMVLEAYDSPVDDPAEDQIERAETALRELATGSGETGMETIGDAMERAMDEIDQSHESGIQPGLTTGLKDLDNQIGGLHPTDLIVIGGRPAMGKTTMACNLARGAAQSLVRTDGPHEGTVALYSLEMSGDQLATRMACDFSLENKIKYSKSRKLKFTDEERRILRQNIRINKFLPLVITDRAPMTLGHIVASCRRVAAISAAKKQPLRLVVIDYLQLISMDRGQHNELPHLTACTRGFKLLAKELRISVVLLSQLNREVEKRDNKRPMLSDLRASGTIEQDADMVLFPYRHEHYLEKDEPRAGGIKHDGWLAEMAECENVMEIGVGKQRHGPTGRVKLHSFMGYGSIRDRAQRKLV